LNLDTAAAAATPPLPLRGLPLLLLLTLLLRLSALLRRTRKVERQAGYGSPEKEACAHSGIIWCGPC
jgi:hypothetical protein